MGVKIMPMIVAHAKCTRANNMNVALPKIRTESGKKPLHTIGQFFLINYLVI